MPSTMTHAYFALDVYDRLDKDSQKRLSKNKEALKTFSQGSDILYFYNDVSLRKAKRLRQLGHIVHHQHSKAFFINLIKYIKENKLEKKGEVIAFLYGNIAHYVLDTTIHPYIFYKTGVFNKKDRYSYRYNGLHTEMESYIDAYMIYTKEGVKPKDFKVHQYCFNIDTFSKPLVNTINYVFKETFDQNNLANIYLKAIQQMKLFFRLFKYDPYGIKKFIYRLIDKISPKSFTRKEPISYYIFPKEKLYYLNLDKNTWYHPVEINETSNASFIELYRISINKALAIIEQVNTVLYENKNIEILDDVFSDLSYVTGRPCDERQRLQYFEF
ncbi:MAG: zinc dependent phospholipase C family protein [Bacilli bacterium]|jgi:hypothetical protein